MHDAKDFVGTGKVLESVQRNDDVGEFRGRCPKAAPVLNAGCLCLLTSDIQHVFPNIDSDHPRGASSRHFNCLTAFAATEANDDFDRCKKGVAHEGKSAVTVLPFPKGKVILQTPLR